MAPGIYFSFRKRKRRMIRIKKKGKNGSEKDRKKDK
jgi:hypothetical protein